MGPHMYPKCRRFFFSDFDQNEANFLIPIRYHKYNICYNSAKPYMIHQRGHLLDKKNLSRGKWVKYGPFNPLLAAKKKKNLTYLLYLYNRPCLFQN